MGRDGRLCQRDDGSQPAFELDLAQVGHLSCGLGLLVQRPPSVPLAQGVPGLRAEPLGRTASLWLVVSNVVESPKPRGEVIPSWGREGEIIIAPLGWAWPRVPPSQCLGIPEAGAHLLLAATPDLRAP